MADVPSWELKGDWFDVCRCRVPCACTFAQAPDEGQCDGILAWRVRDGNYGDVGLDGFDRLCGLILIQTGPYGQSAEDQQDRADGQWNHQAALAVAFLTFGGAALVTGTVLYAVGARQTKGWSLKRAALSTTAAFVSIACIQSKK